MTKPFIEFVKVAGFMIYTIGGGCLMMILFIPTLGHSFRLWNDWGNCIADALLEKDGDMMT